MKLLALRYRARIARGFWMALGAAALLSVVDAPAQAQSALTRHVRQAVRGGQANVVGLLPASQALRLDLVLPLRDPDGLNKFLQALYDPTSPSYRHFLSVAEFTAQFGASEEDYEAVVRYATANGLQVVGGSRDGMDVQVAGPVAAVEKAFNVSMRVYQHPTENRTFYAADREPTVGLSFSLWHISGLDNYSIPRPLLVSKTAYAQAHGVDPESVVSHATTGSGPSASFLGSDMRAAYYGGTLKGEGQNLGLLEFAGTDLADLNTYYANIHLPTPTQITLLSTDGTSTSCVYSKGRSKCDDTEQTLDMTQALGMAPGLASLTVYVGSSDTAILSAMTTHSPLPMTIGCSWGWTPADPTTLNPYLERMAAQGQSFFTASGDNSTWTASGNAEAWPADNAYVISVGGTDLVTASAGGPWLSETAWVDSGGGISPDKIAIPSWQQMAGVINKANNGSTTLRNGPDVAANADFTFYVCSNQTTCTANEWGGTSFAAPMWAGYMALVNQQAQADGKQPLGFINPAIYALGVLATGTDFHDITSGTSGSFSAGVGFDLVTGWGSPGGALLSTDLLLPSTSGDFTISASPSPVSVAQGSSGISTILTNALSGFGSTILLSATGQPAGVTVSFSPASIAAGGLSTMTMTVSAKAVAGTYPITIAAYGGTASHIATVSLTVTAAAKSDFTISALPTSVSVQRNGSGTSTITTVVSGTLSSAIALSATGQSGGVTVSFSPTSIPGTGGTSTMTITASNKATVGTHSITVTGTGGGVTHTTTVSVAVTK